MASQMRAHLQKAWYILYYTYGLFSIIVGIDKCCNIFAQWQHYINPYIPKLLHLEMAQFMYMLAALEIATGLLVFIKPLLGGYITMALLMVVIINLISIGWYVPLGYVPVSQYDTALRALAMFMGAWAFVELTKEREKKNYHFGIVKRFKYE
ncbi:MAG: hypothetical protein AB7F19_06390 [Candidatus Babeliales bacterium]